MIVVDAGNTRIKWATVRDGDLVAGGQAPHRESPDAAVAAFAAALPRAASAVWIANVAGAELERRFERAVVERLGIAPKFAAVKAEQLGVRCGYTDPARLGVDRWLGVLAAFHRARGPACAVSVGTAATLDAVDGAGRHLGGLILAGARLAALALERHTAGIGPTRSAAKPTDGRPPLGRSTDESVGFGAMLALGGAVDRAVAEVAAALDARPAVYLTGGDAAALAPWLETRVEMRPDLVLEGLVLAAGDDAGARRAV